ncbi:MAG: hypothetical protein M1816_007947 [Peltula sp. TS41687]|nr:MAG: hypothetical protein M1816_007947 [Peltula sp. TS41687]
MQFVEKDNAGNITATYVESPSPKAEGSSRIDVIDSLQAFASSIAGVGVGDASASPTSALLYSVLQDTTGRIATVLFAHKLGMSLEPECKMYRLAADFFNDAAMILDCLSPIFPRSSRILVLSMSGVLRAICGVAAGSSKASLSAHFAKWGNLGELNAKDSSQETIISLTGMLAGSLVVSRVSSAIATWSCLITLLCVHLATNYAAVRAVIMRTLSRQRACILFSELFDNNRVLTPEQVASKERIFRRSELIRWTNGEVLGRAKIGVELQALLACIGDSNPRTRSIQNPIVTLTEIEQLFEKEQYILWYDEASKTVLIVLKDSASTLSQIKTWAQALLVAREHQQYSTRASSLELRSELHLMNVLRETLAFLNSGFDGYTQRLKNAGWDLDTAALETRAGFRISSKVE